MLKVLVGLGKSTFKPIKDLLAQGGAALFVCFAMHAAIAADTPQPERKKPTNLEEFLQKQANAKAKFEPMWLANLQTYQQTIDGLGFYDTIAPAAWNPDFIHFKQECEADKDYCISFAGQLLADLPKVQADMVQQMKADPSVQPRLAKEYMALLSALAELCDVYDLQFSTARYCNGPNGLSKAAAMAWWRAGRETHGIHYFDQALGRLNNARVYGLDPDAAKAMGLAPSEDFAEVDLMQAEIVGSYELRRVSILKRLLAQFVKEGDKMPFDKYSFVLLLDELVEQLWLEGRRQDAAELDYASQTLRMELEDHGAEYTCKLADLSARIGIAQSRITGEFVDLSQDFQTLYSNQCGYTKRAMQWLFQSLAFGPGGAEQRAEVRQHLQAFLDSCDKDQNCSVVWLKELKFLGELVASDPATSKEAVHSYLKLYKHVTRQEEGYSSPVFTEFMLIKHLAVARIAEALEGPEYDELLDDFWKMGLMPIKLSYLKYDAILIDSMRLSESARYEQFIRSYQAHRMKNLPPQEAVFGGLFEAATEMERIKNYRLVSDLESRRLGGILAEDIDKIAMAAVEKKYDDTYKKIEKDLNDPELTLVADSSANYAMQRVVRLLPNLLTQARQAERYGVYANAVIKRRLRKDDSYSESNQKISIASSGAVDFLNRFLSSDMGGMFTNRAPEFAFGLNEVYVSFLESQDGYAVWLDKAKEPIEFNIFQNRFVRQGRSFFLPFDKQDKQSLNIYRELLLSGSGTIRGSERPKVQETNEGGIRIDGIPVLTDDQGHFYYGQLDGSTPGRPVKDANELAAMLYTKLLAWTEPLLPVLDPATATGITEKDAQNFASNKIRKTFLFSPDGALNYLPFETLMNPQGKRFVEVADVGYLQSLDVAARIGRRAGAETGKGKVLSIANPAYAANSGWISLPGTQVESDRIANSVPQVEQWLGKNASEPQIRKAESKGLLKNYRLLHFAMHGNVNEQTSELVMAQSGAKGTQNPEQDGYLTDGEIIQLKLPRSVVLLSACDTGLGPALSGAGIKGLPYSFTLAGADAVMMSLWPVDDDGASSFVPTLAQRVLSGMPVHAAMSQLKREFIAGQFGQANSDPRIWAAFILNGLDKPVASQKP